MLVSYVSGIVVIVRIRDTGKVWTQRTSLQVNSKNVIREALVDSKKILLPPLHIKLGLMKQFVKALNKKEEGKQVLKTTIPKTI